MKTRVKVQRAALLEIVGLRLRKAEAEHRRAVESYPERLSAWEVAVTDALEKATAAAKRGKLPIDRYGSVKLTVPERPLKPQNGRDLCNLRRLHKTLEIGVGDTLTLSQEDADAYFGPCEL